MRTSADMLDPGHETFCRLRAGGDVTILLDGLPVRRCVTADEEQGFVIVNVEAPDGHVMVDRITGQVLRCTRLGNVRIVTRAKEPA